MPRKRHKPEEIVTKLRQVDVLMAQGQSVADAVRSVGVTVFTYYRWRQESDGLKSDQVRRMKELEIENLRLWKAVANLTLDKLCGVPPMSRTRNTSAPTSRRCIRCSRRIRPPRSLSSPSRGSATGSPKAPATELTPRLGKVLPEDVVTSVVAFFSLFFIGYSGITLVLVALGILGWHDRHRADRGGSGRGLRARSARRSPGGTARSRKRTSRPRRWCTAARPRVPWGAMTVRQRTASSSRQERQQCSEPRLDLRAASRRVSIWGDTLLLAIRTTTEVGSIARITTSTASRYGSASDPPCFLLQR